MFRVARKIRVGRETGNTHIFFFGLIMPPKDADGIANVDQNGPAVLSVSTLPRPGCPKV